MPTPEELTYAADVLLQYVNENESATTKDGLENNLLKTDVPDDIVTAKDVAKIVKAVQK